MSVSLDSARRWLNLHNRNNELGMPLRKPADQQELTRSSAVDTMLFSACALGAGTLPGMLVGGGAVALGAFRLFDRVIMPAICGGTVDRATVRGAWSGGALITGGLTALVPILGNIVNAKLALLSGVETVAASTAPLD